MQRKQQTAIGAGLNTKNRWKNIVHLWERNLIKEKQSYQKTIASRTFQWKKGKCWKSIFDSV